jgi:hypothetical protein
VAIKNYTTSIAEEKTVGEIMAILAAKGARSIRVDYDDQNRPDAVSFIILIQEQQIPFRLPCNFEGVYKAMSGEYKTWQASNRFKRNPESMKQSRRVAWRIIKDWVAAQMALVEAEQATVAQVFLPYAMAKDGVTMFERFVASISADRALPPAPEEVVA